MRRDDVQQYVNTVDVNDTIFFSSIVTGAGLIRQMHLQFKIRLFIFGVRSNGA